MLALNTIADTKRILLALVLPAILLAGFLFIAPDVQAQTGKLCEGADLSLTGTGDCTAGKDADGNPISAGSKVTNLINDIVNIFSVIVGIVAVIMIIYGGFRYITSGGDSGKVTDARNTIVYAIVGLIIVAFSQFIVKFVLSRIAS